MRGVYALEHDDVCRLIFMQELLGTSPQETAFFVDAARGLLSARQALRWSWPHVFFRAQAIAKDLAAIRASEVIAAAAHASDDAGSNADDARGPRKRPRLEGDAAAIMANALPPDASVAINSAPPAPLVAPVESLESVALRHASLRAPLRDLRLFEARQGQLEGATERLAGVLDVAGLEGDVVSLRAVDGAARAAFVLGEPITSSAGVVQPPPLTRGSAADRERIRIRAAAAAAEAALDRHKGGLPSIRRQCVDAVQGVARSLLALTKADDAEDAGGAGVAVPFRPSGSVLR